ncbi:hypothetical protein JYU04_01210 [Dehalococcoides mccartyi]|nr:hypothetical protein [Dehalococcoides mccartyi]
MSPATAAIVTPESPLGIALVPTIPSILTTSEISIEKRSSVRDRHESSQNPDALNTAWAHIVQCVNTRSDHEESKIITVDLAKGESTQDFSTRLQMLLLFMNRESGSVSATVSPSFRDDTYPAMLALVKGFQNSGASEDWRPDGPRSIRMGNANHLFVSVDMPVMARSSSPDTLIEIISAHKINVGWYDQRVAPRVPANGMTTVMFGVPNSHGTEYSNSIFKRERTRNLSGRSGGIHFSRQLNWSTPAAV